jgi:hypothetical protein
MGNLFALGGTTGYPGVVDTATTQVDKVPTLGFSNQTIQASKANNLAAGIIAIQTELGVLPKGGYASVVARLAADEGLIANQAIDIANAVAVSAAINAELGVLPQGGYASVVVRLDDAVYKVGNQTIAGIKTFSSTLVGNISGNAATVTNGVYTVGNQTLAGWLGIGIAPASNLHIQGSAPSATIPLIHIEQGDANTGNLAQFDAYGVGCKLQYRRANGPIGAPTAALVDNVLGQIQGIGYGASAFGGTGLTASGAMRILAAENFSDSATGGYITFLTTLLGTNSSPVERLRIADNGNISIGGLGAASFGTSAVGVLSIANGTEPAAGAANTVQIYSIDDAANHTIPAFYCEGTNVLATGQADSVSGTRVKMRINGTTVTLLAI